MASQSMGNLGSSDSEPVDVDLQWQHFLPNTAMLIVCGAILFGIWQVFRRKPRPRAF